MLQTLVLALTVLLILFLGLIGLVLVIRVLCRDAKADRVVTVRSKPPLLTRWYLDFFEQWHYRPRQLKWQRPRRSRLRRR